MMQNKDWLTIHFEQTRGHLKAVAYRMLGSTGEAEDAVQEAWVRLNRSESEKIDNLSGWLTTVVARVCLDILRRRKSRPEESLEQYDDEVKDDHTQQPEQGFIIADSVGPALLMILDTLSPAERIAFVLHDLFDLPFEEIAPVIDKSETATRQLASRARRRVKGTSPAYQDSDRQQQMVTAFLAASREGNFDALIKLLHPDAILRADDTAIKVTRANQAKGAPQFKAQISGATHVADTMKGKAAGAQLALVDGLAGATWTANGKPVVVFCFSLSGDKISAIDIVMDPKTLRNINVEVIDSNNRS